MTRLFFALRVGALRLFSRQLTALWVAALCAVALPSLGFADDTDKTRLTRFIENQLSGDARKVTIDGFEGALSARATIRRLAVADRQGDWLVLENVALDWNRARVLRGQIDITELTAGRIALLRQPVSAPQPPSAEAQPFALPDLPVSIQIDAVRADRIELDDSILGEDLAATLSGAVTLADGRLDAKLTAKRIDGKEGLFNLAAAFDTASQRLALDLSAQEGPGGLVVTALGVPGAPQAKVQLSGNDPLTDFTAQVSVATQGTPRLTGAITYAADPQDSATTARFGIDVGGDVTALFAPAYGPFFGKNVQIRAQAQRMANGITALTDLNIDAAAVSLTGAAQLGADGWPDRFGFVGQLGLGGAPVLLPTPGGPTTVTAADLAIRYDAAKGDQWQARVTLADFVSPDASVSALTLTGGGLITQPGAGTGRWTAALDFAAQGLGLADAALSDALGGDVTGRLTARGAEGAPTDITALTVQAPGLSATATAKIEGSANRFRTRVQADVQAADLARFAALSGADLSGTGDLTLGATLRPLDRAFDVTLNGDTRDLSIGRAPVDALLAGTGTVALDLSRDATGTRLRNLMLQTPHASLSGTASLTSADRSTADLTARIPDTSVLSRDLTGPATLTIKAKRSAPSGYADDTGTPARGAADLTITGDLPDATLRITGTVDSAHQAQLNATVDLSDLARYGELTGRDLAGSARLRLDGTGDLSTGGFDLALDGDLDNPTIGVAAVDAALAGDGRLTGRLRRDAQGRLQFDSIRLTTAELAALLDGSWDGQATDARFDARLRDASVLAPKLDGPVILTGQAQGGAAGVDLSVTGTAPGLDLSATATAPGAGPIRFDTRFKATKLSRYRPLIGRPISGRAEGDIRGTLALDTGALQVDLAATTQSLSLGIDQLDSLLNGKGELTLNAARDPRGAITLRGARIATPQAVLTAQGRLDRQGPRGELSADIFDLARVQPGLSGPAALSAQIDAQTAAGQMPFRLTATAPATNLSAQGTIAAPAEGYRTLYAATLRVDRLSAYSALVGQPLSGAITARLNGDALPQTGAVTAELTAETQALSLGVPEADRVVAGTGRLSARAERKPSGAVILRRIKADWPNLTANLTARLSAQGALTADLDARLADLGLLTDQVSGPLTVSGTAGATNGGTSRIDLIANGPGGSTARAQGTLTGAYLDMDVTGSLPLALANPALSPQSLSGTATLDLRVQGPAALEAVSGAITTQGARLALPAARTAITGISGDVTINRGRLSIDLTGRPEDGGRLAISGPLSLIGQKQADLTVEATDLILTDPRLYETTLGGTLRMTGPLDGDARITGRLDLGATEIRIPSTSLGGLGDLPQVQHIGAPAPVARTLDRAGLTLAGVPQGQTTGDASTRSVGYPLDITLAAPSRIFVRGRGLDAELGGQIRLRGTSNDVIPSGRFELLRGRLDILQQRFDLDEGFATLEGDFSPFLRLVASTDTETGTAFITLEGDVTEPKISFSSTPALPEDEVLARLIFGRDLTSISPLQAIQLAAAVNTLAGRGDGGIINKLRLSAGLDDLDITSTEDGTTALRAGKYLAKNIYTDVTVDSTGETSIDLNLDVTKDLTLRGSTSTSGESSLGLFFEQDY